MASDVAGSDRYSDPRASLTRRRLLQAFLELADTDQTRISVGDLTARAGLHRSSFYAHFDGVDDLAALAVHEQLAQIHADNLQRHLVAAMDADASNLLVLRQILEWGRSRPAFLSAAMNHDRAVAEQALGAALRGFVLDYYRAVPAFSALTARRLAVSAEFVGHALAALVCAWLAREIDLSEGELIRHLGLLIPPWVMRPALVDDRQSLVARPE